MSSAQFKDAQALMLSRIEATSTAALHGLPHVADSETGEWTVTPDGDWTGGAWVGELWLAYLIDAARFSLTDVHRALALLAPRIDKKTAFKGFGFYYGAAIGGILFDDLLGRKAALQAAKSLADMFDERLGLIPLGEEAEEASSTGPAESSIDSLQASALLFWAASELADPRLEDIARRHTKRVLENHVREDGSVIQSSTLDGQSGEIIRTHTHKGYSDTSTWGRAQAWAMLYSAHAAVVRPDEPLWLEYATRTADWWMAYVPADKVSFWDFDDPDIPATSRDTAATAIATAGLLRLSYALDCDGRASTYESFAKQSVASLITGYLTPCRSNDERPVGMLTGGCFTRRSTVRSVDVGTNLELIFGSYFLFESLAVLSGSIPAGCI